MKTIVLGMWLCLQGHNYVDKVCVISFEHHQTFRFRNLNVSIYSHLITDMFRNRIQMWLCLKGHVDKVSIFFLLHHQINSASFYKKRVYLN